MFKILVIGILGILLSLISGPDQITIDKINDANLDKESFLYVTQVDMYKVETPSSLGTLIGGEKTTNTCPVEKQCVEYVKSRGVKIESPIYYAKNIQPNVDTPCVGCGVLLFSGGWGHIAYIEKVYFDSILVCEQNLEGCGIVSCRIIQLDDPEIRGFIK